MMQTPITDDNKETVIQRDQSPMKPLQITQNNIVEPTMEKQYIDSSLNNKIIKSVSGSECKTPVKETLINQEPVKIVEENTTATLSNVSRLNKGLWNEDEDLKLKQGVAYYGQCRWKKISDYVGQRSPIQCLHRWTKILKPGLVKGPWTPSEDEKLQAWIKTKGPEKWAECSQFITGRSGKQCRERWLNTLNPQLKKGSWTEQEDELIFKLYQSMGSSWSKIALQVPRRTENSIKNRFYSTLRKIVRIKKMMNIDSKEIAEEEKRKILRSEQRSTLFKILIEYPELDKLIKSKSVKYRQYKRSKQSYKEMQRQKQFASRMKRNLPPHQFLNFQGQQNKNATIEEVNRVLGADPAFCHLVGRTPGVIVFAEQGLQAGKSYIPQKSTKTVVISQMADACTQTLFDKSMQAQSVANMDIPLSQPYVFSTKSSTKSSRRRERGFQKKIQKPNNLFQIPSSIQSQTNPLLNAPMDQSFFSLAQSKSQKFTQNNQSNSTRFKSNFPLVSKLNQFVFLMKQLQTLEGMLNFTKSQISNLNFLQHSKPKHQRKRRRKQMKNIIIQNQNILIQNQVKEIKAIKPKVGFQRSNSNSDSKIGFKRKRDSLKSIIERSSQKKQIKREESGFLSDSIKAHSNEESL